jgi:hypothetical protein
MKNENSIFSKCVIHNISFVILTFISVALIVISFFLPPQGVIDPSVFAGVGEIFAFAALGTVIKAIDAEKSVTLSHGDTSITINGKKYILEDNKEDEFDNRES